MSQRLKKTKDKKCVVVEIKNYGVNIICTTSGKQQGVSGVYNKPIISLSTC